MTAACLREFPVLDETRPDKSSPQPPHFKTGAAWQPHARSVRLRRRSVNRDRARGGARKSANQAIFALPLPARGCGLTVASDARGDPNPKGVVMKTSLIIIAAALAVVAGVSAASATSRPALEPAAKLGCTFATLPRATPAGQQSLYGHIRSLKRKGDHYLLRFRPRLAAQWSDGEPGVARRHRL